MPEPTPAEPVQVTFSRGTWAALVAFALVMFAGIATQLLLIEDQRSTNDRQLKTIVRQANRSIPLLDKTRPLVDQTTQALPAVRRLGRDTQSLLGDLRPLTRELRDGRAPAQLEAAGALARTLLQADVGRMVRALQRADVPRLAEDLRALSSEMLRQQRLRRLLVRSNAVLGEVRSRHLIEKSSRAAESVPVMERILRESLAVQRETFAVQRETLEIARQTQRAAERAARSAESIDRKTGPSLAPTSGG